MSLSKSQKPKTYSPLAFIAFMVIFILLFPITLAGYIIWVVGGVLRGRGSGISGTAQGPLSARYYQHMLGTRSDEASYRLMQALPNVPPLGLKLASWPLLLAHRLTGYVPKAFRYPYQGEVAKSEQASARQTFYDEVVERYLPSMDQLVILGAGFDTRAYRLPAGPQVRVFEVDTPRTQAFKRQLLEKMGLDTRRVTFVSADFEKEDWLARLVHAGYDPTRPALFIWEGVTIYLDQAAVESTLRKIAGTSPGSLVAFDYFTTESLTSQELYWRYARAATNAAGEPLKFGIDSTPPLQARVREFLERCGLTLDQQQTLGDETGGKRAWGGFTTAVVR